jgi:toxin ParE1/3/4
MVKITYSKSAVADLSAIYQFIALDSPVAAKRFITLIRERIQILKTQPEIGRIVYPDKYKNLRQLLYQSY